MSEKADHQNNNKVTLALSCSGSAGSIEVDSINFIQKTAYTDLKGYVKKSLESLPEKNNSTGQGDILARKHDAIFIDGERGCGKTTFMINAITALCTKSDHERDLVSLLIIDPTIISTKENSFVLIISKIVEAVEKGYSPKESMGVDCDFQSWRKKLQTLARGLCMLDNVGANKLREETWGDDQFIMAEGLEDAQGGLKLEQNFHKFVECSLELLGKKAFILGFDDIDTNFDSGWPVLEILRKYLTSPRLIVLLAGDYALYLKLVRRELWKTFNEPNAFLEHETREQLQKTVEQLEEQYLRKILPPERRITLKEVWELEHSLYFALPGEGEPKSVLLHEYLTAVIQLWYKFPDEMCKHIGLFFMHMPLRTVISLLQALDGNEKIRTITAAQAKKVHSASNESPETPSVELTTEEQKHMSSYVLDIHSRIIQACYAQLSTFGFTGSDLHSLQWTGQFNNLANVLLKKNLLSSGAGLFPIGVTQQHGLDILILAGVYYSVLVADIKHVFSYYIRILLLQDVLYTHLNYHGKSIPLSTDTSISYADIKDKLINSSNSLHDICTYCTWLYLNKAEGLLSTPQGNTSEEKQQRQNTLRAQGLFEVKNICQEHVEFNKLINYCLVAWKTERDTEYYFSVYNLFALLGLCIGDNGDLKIELEKYDLIPQLEPKHFHTTKVKSPSEPIGTNGIEVKVQPDKAQGDWKTFLKDNKDYAKKFHEGVGLGEDSRASRSLPPFKHAIVWRKLYEFCATNEITCVHDIWNKYLGLLSEEGNKAPSFNEYIKGSPFSKLFTAKKIQNDLTTTQ